MIQNLFSKNLISLSFSESYCLIVESFSIILFSFIEPIFGITLDSCFWIDSFFFHFLFLESIPTYLCTNPVFLGIGFRVRDVVPEHKNPSIGTRVFGRKRITATWRFSSRVSLCYCCSVLCVASISAPIHQESHNRCCLAQNSDGMRCLFRIQQTSLWEGHFFLSSFFLVVRPSHACHLSVLPCFISFISFLSFSSFSSKDISLIFSMIHRAYLWLCLIFGKGSVTLIQYHRLWVL